MSTYTPTLGLENPAYLSQNNTWGVTENTGRTIIEGSRCGIGYFPLTGTTFSISVTNGTPTSATSRTWVFTGTPSGTCTVTWGPNTAPNWVFVFNNSSQTIILKQGSGTVATVLGGTANIVYFDGGGAGANASVFQPGALTQPPGSVSAPSYSFTGYTDVGLYAPAAHTLGLASNGAAMATFASSGSGPSGLNTLGATLGPYIGNAFSNLDLFSGGWAGPACPNGYYFVYIKESNGQMFLKYNTSTGSQQQLFLGTFTPGNLATFAGAAPPIIANQDVYFQVNEAKTELDFYYKDSGGGSHGPFPIGSYGP